LPQKPKSTSKEHQHKKGEHMAAKWMLNSKSSLPIHDRKYQIIIAFFPYQNPRDCLFTTFQIKIIIANTRPKKNQRIRSKYPPKKMEPETWNLKHGT
jgi:hypothetical protein